MNLKTYLFTLSLCLAVLRLSILGAPLETAFTYQGRLAEGGVSANGAYDFRFTLYDAARGCLPSASISGTAHSTAKRFGWN